MSSQPTTSPYLEEENREAWTAWQCLTRTGVSIFLTGRAGTGKTTFLKKLRASGLRRMAIVAPTGVAAINAGGMTIHSLFQIPPQTLVPGRPLKMENGMRREKLRTIRGIDLLVIDEVSMVRPDLLDAVDQRLRQIRRNSLPFGGVQLLLIGDLLQLPPVVKPNDIDVLRQYYQTPFFFSARSLAQIQYFAIELKKVYRQSDREFIELLNRVRTDTLDAAGLERLNGRYRRGFNPDESERYIRLTSLNREADRVNTLRLEGLKSRAVSYEAVVTGKFPESAYPVDRVLTLKVGAQVMYLRNDSNGRYYNGKIGRVVALEEGAVIVTSDDGYGEIKLEPALWENISYEVNRSTGEIEQKVEGTFRQIPLALAWAITIHKSQGLTFDHVIVDLGRGAFACGQCYVALSRCRTLQGMVLRTPVTPRDIIASAAVRVFSNGANDERLIQGQLDAARADAMVRRAVKEFGDGDYRGAVCDAMEYFAMRPDMLRSEAARRLVARKFGVIGRLEGRVGELMEEMRKMREKTFEFAYEYYLLAAECLNKYDDTRAAKANLNKALALAPDYGEALVMRGRLMLEGGDPEGAIGDLDVALREGKLRGKGKVAEALLLRARARRDMRQWEGAFDDAVDSLNKDKTRGACLLLVEICRHLDREEDADMFSLMADDLLKKKKRKGYDDEEDDE